MPKGGDLHIHLSGAVYAESWIKEGIEDQLCVDIVSLSSCGRPLRMPLQALRAIKATFPRPRPIRISISTMR